MNQHNNITLEQDNKKIQKYNSIISANPLSYRIFTRT
jgi:hypothetical protein